VIETLIDEGYIEQEVKSGFPILRLTERGKKEAVGASLEDLRNRTAGKSGKASSGFEISAGRGPGGGDGATGGRVAGRQRVAATTDEIKLAVLRCIDSMPFAIGVVKIAAVLTGTKAAWTRSNDITELDVYDSVNATQERVRDVIKSMLADRLIGQEGSSERPIIGLTREGREELNRQR